MDSCSNNEECISSGSESEGSFDKVVVYTTKVSIDRVVFVWLVVLLLPCCPMYFISEPIAYGDVSRFVCYFYEEEDRWVRRIVVYCVEFSLMNAW